MHAYKYYQLGNIMWLMQCKITKNFDWDILLIGLYSTAKNCNVFVFVQGQFEADFGIYDSFWKLQYRRQTS